jgi:hypothetical protein
LARDQGTLSHRRLLGKFRIIPFLTCFSRSPLTKNPIKVAPRQIRDLHDLLANRLDPDTCEYYTAGKHRKPGGQKVDVNRPIQLTTRKHKLVYCECIDWDSKNPDDIAHCESLATLSISSNTSTSLIPSTSPTPVPATTTSPQPSTTSS